MGVIRDMSGDGLGRLLLGLFALMAAAVPVAIYEGIQTTALQRRCLAAGWRDASWRWFGPDYCGGTVEMTYIVVPADSVAP